MIKYKDQITFELNLTDGDSKAQGEVVFMLDKDIVRDIGFDKALDEVFNRLKNRIKDNDVDKWVKEGK